MSQLPLLLLAALGMVLLFGINPRKVTLRRRLLALLLSSICFAPFVAALYVYSQDQTAAGWSRRIAKIVLFGPFLLLVFAGIQALGYFAQQLLGLAGRWWRRRRGDPAS